MPKRTTKAKIAPEPRGRPTIYTAEIAKEIIRRLPTESMRSICRDEGMPHEATVRGWVIDDREGFYTQYMRAHQVKALGYAEEITEIADDGTGDVVVDEEGNERVNHDHIQRSRLRVDTRKWVLARVLPKIFGDKLELSGDKENPVRFIIDGLETVKK
jgi:hypothetical protein